MPSHPLLTGIDPNGPAEAANDAGAYFEFIQGIANTMMERSLPRWGPRILQFLRGLRVLDRQGQAR